MSEAGETPVPIRVLVAEDRPFQRRLIAETLRAARRVAIDYAGSVEDCLHGMDFYDPAMIVTDWDLEGGRGLELAKRLRAGDAGEPYRRLPIVMVAVHNTMADVEQARNAGVDEFVLRPFSTAVLIRHVREVRDRQRPFVESAHYTGPCRRRRAEPDYTGPLRRVFDVQDKRDDAPELQIRKGLVRMYVERIGALLASLNPNDRGATRDLCLACGQLSALAGDMSDPLLMSASSSLFNYVTGVGTGAKLVPDVVQAHLDALKQLAELPNYKVELRQTVTQQLGVMVTKKLRASAA